MFKESKKSRLVRASFFLGGSIILIALIFNIFSFNFLNAKAQTVPNQQIASAQANVQVLLVNLSASNSKVSGELVLTNSNEINYPQVQYILELKSKDKIIENGFKDYTNKTMPLLKRGQTINYQESDLFDLGSQESKKFSFELTFPSKISSGEYDLTATLLTLDKNSIGAQIGQVQLNGTGGLLEVDQEKCKIELNGQDYLLFEGPNIGPNDSPQLICEFTNKGKSALTARPFINYQVSSHITGSKIDSEQFDPKQSFKFDPNKPTRVAINLPNVSKPQSYQGSLEFLDERDEQTSFSIPFKWVVAGPSANVDSATLDKNVYKKDETAVITLKISPSMDLYWRGEGSESSKYNPSQGTDLKNVQVFASIYNGSGSLCGSATQTLPDATSTNSWPSQSIKLNINSDCDNPKLNLKLTSDGVELANFSKSYTSPVVPSKNIIEKASKTNLWYLLLGSLGLLALIGGLAYFYYRKKHKKPPIQPGVVGLCIVGLAFVFFSIQTNQINAKAGVSQEFPAPNNLDILRTSGRIQDGAVLDDTGNIRFNGTWDTKNFFSYSVNDVKYDCAKRAYVVKFTVTTKGTDCNNILAGYKLEAEIDGVPSQFKISEGSNLVSEFFWESSIRGPLTSTPYTIIIPADIATGKNVKILLTSAAYSNHAERASLPEWKDPNAWFYSTQAYGTSAYEQYKRSDGRNLSLIKTIEYVPGVPENTFQNCGNGTDRLCTDPAIGVIPVTVSANSCDFCNKACTTPADCEGAKDGCTQCLPDGTGNLTCQDNNRCNEVCTTPADCEGAKDGCTSCLPNDSGSGNVCRPTPACGVACTKDGQCVGAKDGCTLCLPDGSGKSVCQDNNRCNEVCTTPADCQGAKDGCTSCLPDGTGKLTCQDQNRCNEFCTTPADCEGAKDGCTSCLPSDTGTGNVCRPTPACGVACTKDGQCVGAKDGCTACVGGVCKIPPACGVACTTKADCASARDGCSECLEGTCSDFNANMCKCDGINADLTYPGNSFKFEAFGKVEGADVKKAEIADITFRMTKDNQVIAKSNPITPQVVESSASKIRYKAAWSTSPPAISKNSIYRVFADVRCKPKKIIASANENFTPNTQVVLGQSTSKVPPPKGLEAVVGFIDNLFGKDSVKSATGKVLALFSTPSASPIAETNLQLRTLNFIKLMDTDNCKFVMFKFDETLF